MGGLIDCNKRGSIATTLLDIHQAATYFSTYSIH